MRKTTFIILLFLVIAGIGGLGVKKLIPPKQETVKITLAQPEKSLAMVPHYLALKERFFQEYFAEVTVKDYSGDETPREALARGAADIIVMDLADFLYSKYLSADLVAFAVVTAGEPSFIMARDKTQGFSWHDMKDKSIIGNPPESTAGILLEAVLRGHKLAPYRDVTIFYNIPEDLKTGAFKAESSTYIQVSEPLASLLEAEGTAKVVGSLAGERIPALLYVTNSKNVRRHPEKLQRFTNGIYKASLWMKYHRQSLARDLAPVFTDIDRRLVTPALNRYLNENIWPENPLVDKEAVEKFSKMMLATGELPQPVDLSAALENKFAKHAMETVEYIPPEQQKTGLKKYWPF